MPWGSAIYRILAKCLLKGFVGAVSLPLKLALDGTEIGFCLATGDLASAGVIFVFAVGDAICWGQASTVGEAAKEIAKQTGKQVSIGAGKKLTEETAEKVIPYLLKEIGKESGVEAGREGVKEFVKDFLWRLMHATSGTR